MATKIVAFNTTANALVNVASGGSGIVLLGTGTNAGLYPQTAEGITAGWSNGVSVQGSLDQSLAAPYKTFAAIGNGDGSRRIRIDRAAGTFTIKLQAYSDGGDYLSGGTKIYDANGTTVLHTQATTNLNNDAGVGPKYFLTNMTLSDTPTDAGVSITTTGAFFFVELNGLPSFGTKLSAIIYDDGVVSTPTVASISPTSGAIGAAVTLTGTNFTGATAATIAGTAVTSLVVVNATTITGVVASGTTTGAVTVTTPAGTSTGGPTFTVYTPVYTSLSVNNPNTVYTLGQLLAPITVTKRDQLGNPTSLGPTTVTAAEILPGRSVSGTLTRSFVGPTATFDDLVITEDVVVIPPPPEQTGGLTMVQVVSRPATIPARGAVGSVVCRMISAINGAPAAGVVRVSASMIRVPTGAVLTGTTSKLTDSNGNVTFDDLVLVDA